MVRSACMLHEVNLYCVITDKEETKEIWMRLYYYYYDSG